MSTAPSPSTPAAAGAFLLRFACWAALGFALQILPWVDRHLVVPLLDAIAASGAGVMRLFNAGLVANGSVLFHPSGYAVRVSNGCSGLEAVILLGSAMLAFPARWPSRLQGLAAGTALIMAVNVLRVVSLLYVGVYRPDWFDFIHLHLWDVLILADGLLIFVLWQRWAERREPVARPA